MNNRVVARIGVLVLILAFTGGSSLFAQPYLGAGLKQDIISADLTFNQTCIVSEENGPSCWGGGGSAILPKEFLDQLKGSKKIETSNDIVCIQDAEDLKCWDKTKKKLIPNPKKFQNLSEFLLDSPLLCARDDQGFDCWWIHDGATTKPYIPKNLINPRNMKGDMSALCVETDLGLVCWVPTDHSEASVHRFDSLTDLTDYDVSSTHLCAIKNYEILCEGSNDKGQQNKPENAGLAMKISVGEGFTCARFQLGLKCWGDNSKQQTESPQFRSDLYDIVSGANHTCAIYPKHFECWGDRSEGQLTPPNKILNPSFIAVGFDHACALTEALGLQCWGGQTWSLIDYPAHWQHEATHVATGNSDTCVIVKGKPECASSSKTSAILKTEQVRRLTGQAVDIKIGTDHGCVRELFGKLRCWGSNSSDQARVPQDVGYVTDFAVNGDATCALREYDIRCWGRIREDFKKIFPLKRTYSKIVMTDGNICALSTEAIDCWGNGLEGSAVAATYKGAQSLFAGSDLVCALGPDSPFCFGKENGGERSGPNRAKAVKSVYAGYRSSCVVYQSGSVQCFGNEKISAIPQ